jgi:hypothetical protein
VENSEKILESAEDIVEVLSSYHIDAVVIGAVALAAHHYVRQTEDIDLGINASLSSLHSVVQSLNANGYKAVLREPDMDDPLGGVIDVSGSFGLVQIVNYGGRFPAVIDDALHTARMSVRAGSRLKVVPLPYLIALKLYAGGHKSKADIIELIVRNPNLDLDEVRLLCGKYRLAGLEELIREAESG